MWIDVKDKNDICKLLLKRHKCNSFIQTMDNAIATPGKHSINIPCYDLVLCFLVLGICLDLFSDLALWIEVFGLNIAYCFTVQH